ncbi:hypothetical protein ABZ769_22635 [Streptomyces olivoreticuli]
MSSADSWAYVDEANIFHWGPRDLADEVEAAAAAWRKQGSPEMNRYGLTITNTAQHLWLDEPANPIT